MIKKSCQLCNKTFLAHNYRKSLARFCSTFCYNKFRAENAYPIKICPLCRKNFKIYRQTRNHKYCSDECSVVGRRKYEHNDKTCAFCKKIFPFSSRNPQQIFCDSNCNVKSRAYEVNENFFDKINNEGKAYLLGIMFSDGSVSSKTNHINISSNDKDLIDQCKTLLQAESPIHHYNKSFSLIVCNQNLNQDLQKWGVKPRKSWLELSPPEIPKSLYAHFIRGLYDGDGSFFINKIQKGRYNYLCASLTCASKTFLQEIKDLLEEKWKIHFNEIRFDDKSDGKGSYQLRLSSQNDVKTFVQYLYSNAHYFMERKHNFVKSYYGQI